MLWNSGGASLSARLSTLPFSGQILTATQSCSPSGPVNGSKKYKQPRVTGTTKTLSCRQCFPRCADSQLPGPPGAACGCTAPGVLTPHITTLPFLDFMGSVSIVWTVTIAVPAGVSQVSPCAGEIKPCASYKARLEANSVSEIMALPVSQQEWAAGGSAGAANLPRCSLTGWGAWLQAARNHNENQFLTRENPVFLLLSEWTGDREISKGRKPRV